MGAVQKKTLSIVLALSLALLMLGAVSLQLLNAGTAHAAETLGTNLKYQNVSGLMKPSGSQYAYAIMWNDDALGDWDDETEAYLPGSGYDVVRSDGKVTMHIADNDDNPIDGVSYSFYAWDGLIRISNQMCNLDGKTIAKSADSYDENGCAVRLGVPCYDVSIKTGLAFAKDTINVFKNDGSVVQHIALPTFPSASKNADISAGTGELNKRPAMLVEIEYYFPNISEQDLSAVSIPDLSWGVVTDRYWDPSYDYDSEKDEDIPAGFITVAYGLVYNASAGMLEKTKIDPGLSNWVSYWKLSKKQPNQDTWVDLDSETGDYSAYKQTAFSSGVVPYALYRDDDKSGRRYITTAKDKMGTPLLMAGYPVGAQNMRDNNWMWSREIYPENKATGFYFASKDGKYGVIDSKGAVKVPFEYDEFSNNTFCKTSIVLMKKGSAWSFIDLAEKPVPAPAPAPAPAKPTVAKNDVSLAKVTVSSKAYTGKKLKPSTVKVVLNGKTLKKGTDYTVSCAGGKKIGPYKVTIKGKGKYTGTAVSTFTIVPKKVAISKTTPLKGGFTASWKKLSKADRKQVTGFQVRYAKDKSFKKSLGIKEVKKSTAASLKVRTLQKGKTYYVQVRAYKTVDKVKYYSAWSKTVKVKTKKR